MPPRDDAADPETEVYLAQVSRIWASVTSFVDLAKRDFATNPTPITEAVINKFPALMYQLAQIHPPHSLFRFHNDLATVLDEAYDFLLLLIAGQDAGEIDQAERELSEATAIAQVELSRWTTQADQ